MLAECSTCSLTYCRCWPECNKPIKDQANSASLSVSCQGNTKKVRAEQDMPNIAPSCDSESGVSTHSIRERATVGYIAALNHHFLILYWFEFHSESLFTSFLFVCSSIYPIFQTFWMKCFLLLEENHAVMQLRDSTSLRSHPQPSLSCRPWHGRQHRCAHSCLHWDTHVHGGNPVIRSAVIAT